MTRSGERFTVFVFATAAVGMIVGIAFAVVLVALIVATAFAAGYGIAKLLL